MLPWESQADFDYLLNGLVAEHRPATITEQILVREMAESYWRLGRARNQEHDILTTAPEPGAEAAWEKGLTLAGRYITRFERSFHKSFSLLRTLQKERRAAEADAQAKEEERATAEAAKAATPTPEHFVSQNETIAKNAALIAAPIALSFDKFAEGEFA